MSNPFYNVSGVPATGAIGASAPMRSEYALIAAAFDKLPLLTASTIVAINSGGTAMTNLTTTGTGSVVLAASPAITGTVTGSATFSAITLSGITTLPGSGQITAAGLLGIGVAPVTQVDVAKAQNSSTLIRVTNSSTGGSAYCGFLAQNSAESSYFYNTSTGFSVGGMDAPSRTVVQSSGIGGLALHAALVNSVISFGVNSVSLGSISATRFSTSLPITMGGGSTGNMQSSQAPVVVASGGTASLDTGANGGGGWSGFLIVCNTDATNANIRTHQVLSILARGNGADVTFTGIAIRNDGGGAPFTLGSPSNGVVQVTNTHTANTAIQMAYYGCIGF